MCSTNIEVFYNNIAAIQDMQTPYCLVPEMQIMNTHFFAILKTDKPGAAQTGHFHHAVAGHLGELLYLLARLAAKTAAAQMPAPSQRE